ncbi:MAG: 4-(cytidine 5'-diphospho)-2-C-methyl-D-erythritol kinase, partial [Sphingomonadales bacterium]
MRRADGYHELETVFAFAEDGDRLTVAPAEGLSLTITGRFAEGLSADA